MSTMSDLSLHITELQLRVHHDRKLRTALRAHAGQTGSSMPIIVVHDHDNPSPTLAGESGHYVTSGGRIIRHPSAYSRVGWSNMSYRGSTRRIKVDADWLADHLHSIVK